ncbi:hypothetical protein ES703_45157 [subsurface metagenome]
MTEPEPELCYHCGEAKRIVMELKNQETGERRFYCQEGADEWCESDKPWPPNTNTANTN